MKVYFDSNMKMYVVPFVDIVDEDGTELRISNRNKPFYNVEYVSLKPYGEPDVRFGQLYEHVWKVHLQYAILNDELLMKIMSTNSGLMLSVRDRKFWLSIYDD